jgi:hypothetical protein
MALKTGTTMGLRATLLGLGAGAMFAVSAIGFRGAILSLGLPSYVMAATFTLAIGLLIQSALLSLYLAVRDRAVLAAIVRAWRPSLLAGFLGALASQFWFWPSRLRPLRACAQLLVECCSRRRFRACSSNEDHSP